MNMNKIYRGQIHGKIMLTYQTLSGVCTRKEVDKIYRALWSSTDAYAGIMRNEIARKRFDDELS